MSKFDDVLVEACSFGSEFLDCCWSRGIELSILEAKSAFR
jgi:hypothetical protein